MASQPDNVLRGGVLRPNAAIQDEYVQSILVLVRRMCDETKRAMKRVFSEARHHGAMDDRQGDDLPPFLGQVEPQSRFELNRILAEYEQQFNRFGKKATKRMLARTLKNTQVTLGMSLKDLSDRVALKFGEASPLIQEIVSASATEAVSLIRLIPQKYVADVQGAVSRSITSGRGLQDLVPFLAQKYDSNIRHARNVALDQTRKSYQTIASARMQAVGVREYEWVHAGGSAEPRKLHLELSGKIFRFDDPPVIGVMYGKEVRGGPSMLPFCRCVARPVVKFEE